MFEKTLCYKSLFKKEIENFIPVEDVFHLIFDYVSISSRIIWSMTYLNWEGKDFYLNHHEQHQSQFLIFHHTNESREEITHLIWQKCEADNFLDQLHEDSAIDFTQGQSESRSGSYHCYKSGTIGNYNFTYSYIRKQNMNDSDQCIEETTFGYHR